IAGSAETGSERIFDLFENGFAAEISFVIIHGADTNNGISHLRRFDYAVRYQRALYTQFDPFNVGAVVNVVAANRIESRPKCLHRAGFMPVRDRRFGCVDSAFASEQNKSHKKHTTYSARPP